MLFANVYKQLFKTENIELNQFQLLLSNLYIYIYKICPD